MKKIIEGFRSAPENLQGLLTRIHAKRRLTPGITPKQVSQYMANLVSAARHVVRLLKTHTLDATKIAGLFDIEGRLEQYLIRRGFSRFTVQNKLSAVRVLVRHASSFGFDHASFRLAAEWNRNLKLIRPRIGFSTIVAFAVSNKVHPSRFIDSHLEEWSEMKFRQGKSQLYVSAVKAAFRNAIRDANLGSVFPRLSLNGRKRPLACPQTDTMHPALRSDISRILVWVRQRVSQGRLKLDISILRRDLVLLCAHVVSLPGKSNIRTVHQVLRRDHLHSYIQWLRTGRNCKRSSVASRLTRIHTLIQVHPRFRKQDFGWWTQEIRKYRPEPLSALKGRRRQRLLAYEELAAIPARMERARQALQDPLSRRAMWLLHDEILMHMLISALVPATCVWRCRVAGPRPNVFRGRVSKDDARLAIPEWADRILQAQPEAEFWLFRFFPSDAPTLKEAHGFVLSDFAPLLELYVEKVRPRLLGSKHTDQLFLHRRGGGLTCKYMRARILNLTMRFGGKAVVPGSIRESFGDYWLELYPEDYETLSDVLWMELPSVLRKYVPAETIVA